MSASSGGSAMQFNGHDVDRFMRECDRMEGELGEWLVHRVARIQARRGPARKGVAPVALRPSLWRALIHIWATSPDSKAKYSCEARTGLVSATSSMEPRALMCLVSGLLEVGHSVGAGPAAA
jgi:hypothetical protein